MTDPAAGLAAQLRNIEREYGKPIKHWFTTISKSKLTKHNEVVAMLKTYGLAHGAAHRLSIEYRAQTEPKTTTPALSPNTEPVKRIYETLLAHVSGLSADVNAVPKRGYVSLRRARQFAMLKPTKDRVDVGLILKGLPPTGRLEDAGSFNRLFTHRVRVTKPTIDRELARWIRAAHTAAGD